VTERRWSTGGEPPEVEHRRWSTGDGAASGNRTPDNLITSEVLCRLS
jgi:hypothetical protein